MKRSGIFFPLLLFFLSAACTAAPAPASPSPRASPSHTSTPHFPATPVPPAATLPAPEPMRVVQGHPVKTSVLISWSPDGKLLASSGWGGQVIVWDAQTLEPIHTLTHPEMAYADFTRFSPNGRWLMVSEVWRIEDSYQTFAEVSIWDLETGTRLGRVTDHASVYDAVWSPDGNVLAYVTANSNAIQFWTAPEGENAAPEPIAFPTTRIQKMRWLADGMLMAMMTSEGDLGRMFIWRSTDPETMSLMPGPYVDFSTNDISPDGSWLAAWVSVPAAATVNGVDLAMYVWDTATGNLRRTFQGIDVYRVSALAISPEDARLAMALRPIEVSTNGYQEVRVWDLASGGVAATLPGGSSEIVHLAFSPDGRTLAAGEADGGIRLWQLDAYLHPPMTPTSITTSTPVPVSNVTPVFRTSLSVPGVNPDNPGQLNSLRWLDQNTLHLIALSHYADPITWQTTWQQRIAVYDLLNGQVIDSDIGAEQFREGLAGQVRAYSPDGTRFAHWLSIVIAPGQGTEEAVEVLDTATNALIFQIPPDQIGRGNEFAWSPDGNRIAVQTFESIELYEALTGAHLMTLENVIEQGEEAEYGNVIWSSDGKWIASSLQGAMARFRVIVWDAESGAIFRIYEREPDWKEGGTSVDHIAFSPDGGRLLLVKGDVEVLELLTGELQLLPPRTSLGQFVGTGAWSADGVYVAADYREIYMHTASVLIWNTETGEAFIPFRRATEGYSNSNLVWAPDRPWLATMDEGIAYVLNAEEQALIRLELETISVPNILSWSPDGSQLALGSQEGTVEVWGFSE